MSGVLNLSSLTAPLGCSQSYSLLFCNNRKASRKERKKTEGGKFLLLKGLLNIPYARISDNEYLLGSATVNSPFSLPRNIDFLIEFLKDAMASMIVVDSRAAHYRTSRILEVIRSFSLITALSSQFIGL